MGICRQITALFMDRFNPSRPSDDKCYILRDATRIREQIEREVDSRRVAPPFLTLVDAVESTLRTNYFLPNRFACVRLTRPREQVSRTSCVLRGDVRGGRFGRSRGAGGAVFHIRFQAAAGATAWSGPSPPCGTSQSEAALRRRPREAERRPAVEEQGHGTEGDGPRRLG